MRIVYLMGTPNGKSTMSDDAIDLSAIRQDIVRCAISLASKFAKQNDAQPRTAFAHWTPLWACIHEYLATTSSKIAPRETVLTTPRATQKLAGYIVDDVVACLYIVYDRRPILVSELRDRCKKARRQNGDATPNTRYHRALYCLSRLPLASDDDTSRFCAVVLGYRANSFSSRMKRINFNGVADFDLCCQRDGDNDETLRIERRDL